MKSRKFIIGAALIVFVGMVLGLAVQRKASIDYEIARTHYIESEHSNATAVAAKVEGAFRQIYENLRTLSELPSVRRLDRHGTNLSADGRGSIQQIYNNLANSVAVSEVYFVPVEFDPERFDKATGKLEEPILMFDELIIDAGRFANAEDPFSELAAAEANGELIPEIEEYEMDEYHQLVEQVNWLKKFYPQRQKISGLNVPMISGSEVITCDNTYYINTMWDGDRSGIMFSVPFYNANGILRGSVTAIILTNAIRQFLPVENFALVNTKNNYVVNASKTGQEILSSKFASAGKIDPTLIFSEVLPIISNDPRTGWSLWVGHPNSKFSNSVEFKAIQHSELSGYAVVTLLVLAALLFWLVVRHHAEVQKSVSAELEKRVAERTAEIHHMALHDALTGLPNRDLLRQKIDDNLAHVRRGEKLAVLCLDLDRFKSINDTLGHPVGDALLRTVAERMLGFVRDSDTVARVGGDEFIILLTELTCPEIAAQFAQRLIDRIAEPFEIEGHQMVVGISIGIAIAQTGHEASETLIKNADLALYRAKMAGRGQFCFFEQGMDADAQNRRKLETSLREARAMNELVLHYQPLVDTKSGQVIGFEALLRWNHPELGMLPAAEFIPIAEETGLITEIGEWVLQQACNDAALWPKDIRVAINLSAVQFNSSTLGHTIVKVLDQSGLLPSRLELEITESLLLTVNESVSALLKNLSNMGVQITMDDFGTGYSSLSYLQVFPFNKIKIDRSFIKDIETSESNVTIVETIVAMGKSLGMTTTAEGIETPEQLKKVRELGCTELQGHYFSPPVPVEELSRLLKDRAAA